MHDGIYVKFSIFHVAFFNILSFQVDTLFPGDTLLHCSAFQNGSRCDVLTRCLASLNWCINLGKNGNDPVSSQTLFEYQTAYGLCCNCNASTDTEHQLSNYNQCRILWICANCTISGTWSRCGPHKQRSGGRFASPVAANHIFQTSTFRNACMACIILLLLLRLRLLLEMGWSGALCLCLCVMLCPTKINSLNCECEFMPDARARTARHRRHHRRRRRHSHPPAMNVAAWKRGGGFAIYMLSERHELQILAKHAGHSVHNT